MIIQNINGTENGHSFVDLGLPSGLLWATCNVGAKMPWETGLYFAWGETAGFTAEQLIAKERKFNKSSYKLRSKLIETDFNIKQDAAHVNMGGKWCMPTKEDFQKLIDNCDVTWTDDYKGTGVKGIMFISKSNGVSIFLPSIIYKYGMDYWRAGAEDNYWTSYIDDEGYPWYIHICPDRICKYLSGYYYGRFVRGVCDAK